MAWFRKSEDCPEGTVDFSWAGHSLSFDEDEVVEVTDPTHAHDCRGNPLLVEVPAPADSEPSDSEPAAFDVPEFLNDGEAADTVDD